MARTMGDASKVAVAGGDGSNLYYFYTGGSYRDNSVENIAAFAQEHFDSCKGKSVEDIEANHIFWGTEGPSYKGFYNGDTYVLFDDPAKLPKDVQQDAYVNCKGLREARAAEKAQMTDTVYALYDEFMAEGAWMGHAYGFENMREYYEPMTQYMQQNGMDTAKVDAAYQDVVKEFNALSNDESRSFLRDEDTAPLEKLDRDFLAELAHAAQMTADKLNIKDIRFEDEPSAGISPSEFDPVKIKYISDKCVEQKVGKDGSPYYRIGVSVGKSFSENGFANINVRNGVEKRNNVWSVEFPDNKPINMDIVQDGKHKRVTRVVSDLADAHAEQLAVTKGQRRLPNVPEVTEDDKSLQME